MSGTYAALRCEPVGCVVTIVAGDKGAVQILDVISNQTDVVRCQGEVAEHFTEVHGSLVYVGTLPAMQARADAAIIYELPEGRIKASGTARFRALPDGMAEVSIDADLPGGHIRLRATCSGTHLVADDSPTPLREIR